VVLFAWPGPGAVTLALLFGIFAIVYGVSHIVTGIRLHAPGGPRTRSCTTPRLSRDTRERPPLGHRRPLSACQSSREDSEPVQGLMPVLLAAARTPVKFKLARTGRGARALKRFRDPR
jgi:hypothetical protein